ncbi:hypothetical protein [Thiocapsa roseopersicina]|uniref:4Fe-4S ferredoxin-type domain-containing protein n=1 Tax=Thiocapsa roseopersicina TaxID=1058 RepID=A0A1H3DQR9_THIRO|nr:hypothetical protein [Thiocapsa roseopersicina]SDX68882.1 hypothetical protein SAMN05421783_1562 [Thiocapsa roseopersicina]
MAHVINSNCINCDVCVEECGPRAIFPGPEIYVIDPAVCNDCRDSSDFPECVEVCPVDCILPAGKVSTPINIEVLKEQGKERLRLEEARKPGPVIAKIEQPFGVSPPIVHCPICGQAAIIVEDHVALTNPCPHLAFIFVGEVGEFEYRSPDFMARTTDQVGEATTITDEDDEGDYDDDDIFLTVDNFPELLRKAGYDNSFLALEITYSGMACGPIGSTDIYGYDYALIESDDGQG